MLNRLREMIRQRENRKQLYSSEFYWNSKASQYDESAVSMWPNKILNGLYEVEQEKVIEHYIRSIEGRSMLDLGCGTGRFSRKFASKGAIVTGIDFSQDSLTIARRLSPSINPTFLYGSVFDLDEERKYDIVFTWGVLTIACQNKNQLLDALIKIKRLLNSDGILFLTEPVHRGFLHRVLDLGLPEFLGVMREAGFEIKVTTPLHFWPMRLVLSYISLPAWITVPLYHFGQTLMKIPGLSKLGDYWAILAVPQKTEEN